MDPAGNRIWFLTSSTTCLNVIQGHKLGADGSSTAVFPRPKPQNLGGLVGGEAEFDPLGFSDTFDAPGTLMTDAATSCAGLTCGGGRRDVIFGVGGKSRLGGKSHLDSRIMMS